MANRWLAIWIACLLVLSAGLAAWHHYGMRRTLVIGPGSNYPFELSDDRSTGEGESIASFTRTPDALVIGCDVKPGYRWPFCGYRLIISTIGKGINLPGFDTVSFDIGATGPMAVPVGIYLRNFNPAYAKAHDPDSLKRNTYQYGPDPEPQPFVVPLANFQVASWWIQQNHIPPREASPDLSNVTSIDIATGSPIIPGQYRIVVRAITFHGKWLSDNQLLSIVLALWLASGVVYLVGSFWRAQRAARVADLRKRELESSNAALEQQRHQLEITANHDELTGAYNRVGLRSHLEVAMARARQGRAPLSIIFMDLDHFKDVNDSHGHTVGDSVLQGFAAFVTRHVRGRDVLCRWGGEEFILLCPDTPLDVAAQAADRLCTLMASEAWPSHIAMHCSFGVAEMGGDEDAAAFIARADGALYRAKRAGRNRVEVSRGEGDVSGEPAASQSACEP